MIGSSEFVYAMKFDTVGNELDKNSNYIDF